MPLLLEYTLQSQPTLGCITHNSSLTLTVPPYPLLSPSRHSFLPLLFLRCPTYSSHPHSKLTQNPSSPTFTIHPFPPTHLPHSLYTISLRYQFVAGVMEDRVIDSLFVDLYPNKIGQNLGYFFIRTTNTYVGSSLLVVFLRTVAALQSS